MQHHSGKKKLDLANTLCAVGGSRVHWGQSQELHVQSLDHVLSPCFWCGPYPSLALVTVGHPSYQCCWLSSQDTQEDLAEMAGRELEKDSP